MTAKKTPAKKAAKSSKKVERAKKEGLRDPQARILRVLKSAKGPMNKAKINEACAKAGFETAKKFMQWMADPLGSTDPAVRKAAEDRCGYQSLIALGMVTFSEVFPHGEDAASEWVYKITAKGKTALESYDKAQKAKERE